MRLLLDTHALLWWVLDAESLGRHARKSISELGNEVYVSAATVWEIATKYRLGKLPEAEPLIQDIESNLKEQGFLEQPVTISHA